MQSLGFFIGLIFMLKYGTWVNSASKGNEYQRYLLEVKEVGTED
jgi:hypothetical protein